MSSTNPSSSKAGLTIAEPVMAERLPHCEDELSPNTTPRDNLSLSSDDDVMASLASHPKTPKDSSGEKKKKKKKPNGSGASSASGGTSKKKKSATKKKASPFDEEKKPPSAGVGASSSSKTKAKKKQVEGAVAASSDADSDLFDSDDGGVVQMDTATSSANTITSQSRVEVEGLETPSTTGVVDPSSVVFAIVPPPSCSSTTTSSSKKSTFSSPGKHGKPTYITMVHDALSSMGDRSGSSVPAITKYLMAHHEHLRSVQAGKFKHSLNMALKSALKAGRFVKVKNSYKINTEWVKKEKQAFRAKEAEKKAREKKRQKEVEKARAAKKKRDEEKRREEAKLREEELERKRKEEEEEERKRMELEMTDEERAELEKKRAAEAEAARRKAEAAARAKLIAERIRRRRFPMDDQELVAEDKELGVKPPETVCKRPTLPYAMACTSTVPFIQRTEGGRAPTSIISASSGSGADYGSRGLMSDLMQVFHFFRGDVGYRKDDLTPPFTIKHLMHAVDEILCGNAKRARAIPPLVSHLFVTTLGLLTKEHNESEHMEDHEYLSPTERRLRADLSKLGAGLHPLSWAEVCRHYMDVMERFYASSLSVEPNVLPGGTINMDFLKGEEPDSQPIVPTGSATAGEHEDKEDEEDYLPDGYYGYLGDPRGSLARAHAKLSKYDPWNLSAEELMALLRALTDDVLGTQQELSVEISGRGDELYELLKAKRAADSHYRKIKLAHEGPKHPSKGRVSPVPSSTQDDLSEGGKKSVVGSEEKKKLDVPEKKKDNASEEKNSENVSKEKKKESVENDSSKSQGSKSDKKGDPKSAPPPKFKPTATKKQLDAADKARAKANDAYERGLSRLSSRTEPLGYDRNHNAVFFFQHDPERLYIEVLKPSASTSGIPKECQLNGPNRSWHVIETKSLFDQFLSSLDVRGVREQDLDEALAGVRRHLYDDIKERTAISARKREEEDLERRLTNAKIACAAEEERGRRSGRLASLAQVELAKIEEEIKVASALAKAEATPKLVDFVSLTGLEILSEFDSSEDGHMTCSSLWKTDEDEESGAIGSVVGVMLDLEGLCNELAPWERKDISRRKWMDGLRGAVLSWNRATTVKLGAPAKTKAQRDARKEMVIAKNEEGMSGDDESSTHGKKSKRTSSDTPDGRPDGKKRKKNSDANLSVPQILSVLKQPLLDIEQRVFSITGLEMASQAADEAGDNVSAASDEADEDGDDDSKERRKMFLAWRKKIHSLKDIPAKRSGAIREIIVSAIAAARKAHLNEVVAELRSALLMHSPKAAGTAKTAALNTLAKRGGYKEEGDDDEESEPDDMAETKIEENDEDVATLLCGEAMMITGSLCGDDTADRVDWRDAVKSCKTLSRFSALAHAFIQLATEKLQKLENDKEALQNAIEYWEEHEELSTVKGKGGKTKGKRKKHKFNSATEVWANIRLTQKFVMGKVVGYPWWPARLCEAKDSATASSLEFANRVLISFVGEEHLHVVKKDEVRPYTDQTIEDLKRYEKETIKNLKESTAMARRIRRGRGIESERPLRSCGFVEEKKSAV